MVGALESRVAALPGLCWVFPKSIGILQAEISPQEERSWQVGTFDPLPAMNAGVRKN